MTGEYNFISIYLFNENLSSTSSVSQLQTNSDKRNVPRPQDLSRPLSQQERQETTRVHSGACYSGAGSVVTWERPPPDEMGSTALTAFWGDGRRGGDREWVVQGERSHTQGGEWRQTM